MGAGICIMSKEVLKLVVSYFITFGTLGIIFIFSEGLHDYNNHGDFFMRTSISDFVFAFLTVPISTLYNLASAFFEKNTLAFVWDTHLIFLLYMGTAIFGLVKNKNIIFILASLIPIMWGVWTL